MTSFVIYATVVAFRCAIRGRKLFTPQGKRVAVNRIDSPLWSDVYIIVRGCGSTPDRVYYVYEGEFRRGQFITSRKIRAETRLEPKIYKDIKHNIVLPMLNKWAVVDRLHGSREVLSLQDTLLKRCIMLNRKLTEAYGLTTGELDYWSLGPSSYPVSSMLDTVMKHIRHINDYDYLVIK